MSACPRVWLLLGHRRGDNNQLLALGEALGVPFETRTLSYRRTARPIMRVFPRSIAHLTRASRKMLGPPWPDLVLGIGRRSVPVARWIRTMSGGETGLIRLGHPRAPNDWFDLVLTTPQYPVPAADNVVTLPLALNRFRDAPLPTAEEQRLLGSLPRPHILLSLGGNAPMWRLDSAALTKSIEVLLAQASGEKGTLLIASSPRTSAQTLAFVRSRIAGRPDALLLGPEVRYGVALSDADLQVVTADSVSMISEAIVTGKPVAIVPVERTLRGRIRLGAGPDDNRLRDTRRFWQHAEALGLLGSLDRPRTGNVPDPVALAVEAIRSRFPTLFDRQS
jgi:mitochondrial fission protein ELM1